MDLKPLKKMQTFDTAVRNKPVLYRPQTYNFKAIDGVIVFIEPREKNKKPKLFMFPLQITPSPATHEDSHAKFFEEYFFKWKKDLSRFDVVPEFLWITPRERKVEEHEESRSGLKWPAHKERWIPLKDVSQEIWEEYTAALARTEEDAGENAEAARALQATEAPAPAAPKQHSLQAQALAQVVLDGASQKK